jgi:hypothetical protein
VDAKNSSHRRGLRRQRVRRAARSAVASERAFFRGLARFQHGGAAQHPRERALVAASVDARQVGRQRGMCGLGPGLAMPSHRGDTCRPFNRGLGCFNLGVWREDQNGLPGLCYGGLSNQIVMQTCQHHAAGCVPRKWPSSHCGASGGLALHRNLTPNSERAPVLFPIVNLPSPPGGVDAAESPGSGSRYRRQSTNRGSRWVPAVLHCHVMPTAHRAPVGRRRHPATRSTTGHPRGIRGAATEVRCYTAPKLQTLNHRGALPRILNPNLKP